jgi:AraC family transcriptional regulator
MKNNVRSLPSIHNLPPLSTLTQQWEGITVEYSCMNAIGEFDFAMPKNTISVAFVPHNRVTWSVDGASTQTTALPPGSVFLYCEHDFVWHYREQISEYINITLDQQLLNQVAVENSVSTPVEIEHRVIFPDNTILYIAQLLKAEIFNEGLAGKIYTESLRNLLMIHLLRNYNRVWVKPQSGNKLLDTIKLKQVKDFIEEKLAENITIADMAAVVHISQFHFARAFKTATGESPHRYLTQRRIERAKVLLSVTRLAIAEVAYRVGFYNQSHFTAQFRKLTGVTPKQYRDCL